VPKCSLSRSAFFLRILGLLHLVKKGFDVLIPLSIAAEGVVKIRLYFLAGEPCGSGAPVGLGIDYVNNCVDVVALYRAGVFRNKAGAIKYKAPHFAAPASWFDLSAKRRRMYSAQFTAVPLSCRTHAPRVGDHLNPLARSSLRTLSAGLPGK